MRCAIWYYLYNLKNVKNIHGGVLLLVKAKNYRKACQQDIGKQVPQIHFYINLPLTTGHIFEKYKAIML